MSLPELISEIEQLSLDEQLELLEKLSRHIRTAVRNENSSLRGILATEQPLEEEELKADYIDYLDEKYR